MIKKRKVSRFAPALVLLALGPGSLARGENASGEIEQAEWTRLNQYSPVDAFQSKGSFGWHLAVGGLSSQNDERRDEAGDNPKETTVPRVFLSKGTPWPIDFGVSASHFPKTGATQLGGHIQYTLFERFQLPSLALRYSHINLQGMRQLDRLDNDTLQLGVSYGLFSYITLSLHAGIQRENGNTRAYISDAFTLAAENTKDWTIERKIYGWGVNLVPFTPFVQLGLEQIYWDGRAQSSVGKISFFL